MLGGEKEEEEEEENAGVDLLGGGGGGYKDGGDSDSLLVAHLTQHLDSQNSSGINAVHSVIEIKLKNPISMQARIPM